MNQAIFERERVHADALARIDARHADYWQGYGVGVRRAHLGDAFSDETEHARWLSLADSGDRRDAARGRGYRDGLAVG